MWPSRREPAPRGVMRLPAIVFQIANLHPCLPAAATVRLRLLDDLGPAPGARAERCTGAPTATSRSRGRACPRLPPRRASAPASRRSDRRSPRAGHRDRDLHHAPRFPSGGGSRRPAPTADGRGRTRRCNSSRIWATVSGLVPVLPPEHERAALPPARAAEPPLALDHRPAAPRAVAELAPRRSRRSSPERIELAGVPDDLAHEPARVELAALDLAELRLPLAGQLGLLQAAGPGSWRRGSGPGRSRSASSCRARCSPRSSRVSMIAARVAGRAQALLLERLLELLVVHQLAGRLHRPEQAVLGEVLRRAWSRPPCRNGSCGPRLAGPELGQVLLVVVRFVVVGLAGDTRHRSSPGR